MKRTKSGKLRVFSADAESRPRHGRVTLRDVALAADVSPMTVSNLVNGRVKAMRPETRSRIEAEIERLGYRPHTMARSLRLSAGLSIGMIIVDDAPHYLADPFITHLVAGLSNELNAHGYGLLLQGQSEQSFRTSPIVRDIRTDGICALLSGSDSSREGFIETLLRLGQPLVVFQETLRFAKADLCSIRQADRAGGRMLGFEVIAAGAQRLVMPVPQLHWPAIGERIKGVRDAIYRKDSGITLRVLKCGNADFHDTQLAIERDIDEHGVPDAILAGNDQMGIAVMKFLKARNLEVPRDVMITGFNAFEFWQYTDPVLTTVRSPAYSIGSRGGVEILKRLVAGSFATREILYPVELQRGCSVSPVMGGQRDFSPNG
jgi:LacI family transcriptional regulator